MTGVESPEIMEIKETCLRGYYWEGVVRFLLQARRSKRRVPTVKVPCTGRGGVLRRITWED